MKGKISFYYNAPNTGKVRSRLANAPKEFTPQLRSAITEALVETLNEQVLSIRAKLIQKFAAMELPLKEERYAAQLTSALSPYFDVFVSETPFKDGEDDEAEEETIGESPAPAKEDDIFED